MARRAHGGRDGTADGDAERLRLASLQERLGDDRGIIEEGPAPLPIDWPRVVDAQLPDEAIKEIRSSMHRY